MARSAGAGVWTGSFALGLAYSLTAIGVYLTFRVLDFPDLTVDASFPAGAAMASVVITNNLSPWLSLPSAFALGAAFGAMTGIAHIVLRINSLLASILTVTAAFTINLRIQGSANVPLLGVDTVYTPFLTPTRDLLESWFGDTGVQIHRNVVTMLVCGSLLLLVVLALHVFFRTEVGIAMRATGANPRMSRSQGIDTRVYVVAGVALSNAQIGVSGSLVAQHQGFADVNSGAGLIIAGLAAVIIGEVLFVGRGAAIWRHLIAVSLGMIVYRTAIGLTLSSDFDLPFVPALRLEPTDVRLVTAIVVAILLAMPRIRDWRRTRERG
jgi:putative ABC transport system permease protein